MAPYPCSCGRSFQSTGALAQHRAAKHGSQLPVQPQVQPQNSTAQLSTRNARSPPRNVRSRDSRLWRGVLNTGSIAEINSADLRPSRTPVSIATPSQLVCSYNWQCVGGFHVPGHAPIWQDVALPTSLPREPTLSSSSKPKFTTSTYPFEQVFQATSVMSPDFRFNKIDIVTTRNSLRKFLKFCTGGRPDSFRVDLSIVKNTMFIEQYNVIDMTQGMGWGHSFEKAFTKYPLGLEGSTTHDRFLQYPIGDLNCLVGFEVDACYEENDDESGLQDGLERLSLDNPGPSTALPKAVGKCSMPPPSSRLPPGTKIMPQSTAAELKTCKLGKSGITAYLPQLWFGRTSWLITGSHNQGTFTTTTITDVSSRLAQWETERQQDLRRLAAFLAALREAVRKSGKPRCCLMYEKIPMPEGGIRGGPNVVKLFAVKPTSTEKVVPEEAFSQFWS